MSNRTPSSITELLQRDRRYKVEAYALVFNALRYGHEELGMGSLRPGKSKPKPKKKAPEPQAPEKEEAEERHLTGQELCEAIRLYSLEQYGYMAKCVLNSWGLKTTGDFGEIVFNLIRIGEMRKTDDDRREDFDNLYDFDQEFCEQFQIDVPKPSGQ